MRLSMQTSIAQITANQLNSKKSTGPITELGKNKVSTNAIKHGLYSKNLILADEDELEYQNLLEQLYLELNPIGLIEQTLVERISIAIWRQKWPLRSETTHIDFTERLYIA